MLVRVEAKNVKEAMRIASENASPSICHQCAGEVELGDMDDSNFTEDCVCEIKGRRDE